MMAAARLACSLNRIDQLVVDRQQKILETLGLPVSTQTLNGIENENLLGIMSRDKKNIGGNLRFILPSTIGEVETVDNVPQELVTSAINCLRRDTSPSKNQASVFRLSISVVTRCVIQRALFSDTTFETNSIEKTRLQSAKRALPQSNPLAVLSR